MITSAQPFISLKSDKYINLTTFRMSGEAVATPLYSSHLPAPSSSRSLPRSHTSIVSLFFNR
jgi:hypothetical protein